MRTKGGGSKIPKNVADVIYGRPQARSYVGLTTVKQGKKGTAVGSRAMAAFTQRERLKPAAQTLYVMRGRGTATATTNVTAHSCAALATAHRVGVRP